MNLGLGQKSSFGRFCIARPSSGPSADSLAIAGKAMALEATKVEMHSGSLCLCLRSLVGLGWMDDLELNQGCRDVSCVSRPAGCSYRGLEILGHVHGGAMLMMGEATYYGASGREVQGREISNWLLTAD